MANVPVPEDGILAVLGALVTAAFGWLYRLEIGKSDKIDIKSDFDEVKQMLRDQNTQRELLISEVGGLKTAYAVLASQQASKSSGFRGA